MLVLTLLLRRAGRAPFRKAVCSEDVEWRRSGGRALARGLDLRQVFCVLARRDTRGLFTKRELASYLEKRNLDRLRERPLRPIDRNRGHLPMRGRSPREPA